MSLQQNKLCIYKLCLFWFCSSVFLDLGLIDCVCILPGQVSQLYDVVQKWDAVSSSVPQVVQRLVAVKELHEQGNAQVTADAIVSSLTIV